MKGIVLVGVVLLFLLPLTVSSQTNYENEGVIDYLSLEDEMPRIDNLTYSWDEADDNGRISWNICNNLEIGIYNLKNAYRDEDLHYLKEVIDTILMCRDDRRGVNSYINNNLEEVTLKTWRGLAYSRIIRGDSMFSCYGDQTLNYTVYVGPNNGIDEKYFAYPDLSLTGRILQTILRFVVTVDSLDNWNEIGGLTYRNKLITDCKDSYDEYTKWFEDTIVNGDTLCGEWKYIYDIMTDNEVVDKFYPQYPFVAHSRHPYNKGSTMADAGLFLYTLTGEYKYYDQTRRFAGYFKGSLDDSTFDNCYVYAYSVPYYFGAGDDISHAGLSFIYACDFMRTIPNDVFNMTDMLKFSNTFTDLITVRNLENHGSYPYNVYSFIDGVYHKDPFWPIDEWAEITYRYTALGVYNPHIFEIIYTICGGDSYVSYYISHYNPFCLRSEVDKMNDSLKIEISIISLNNYVTLKDTIHTEYCEVYKNGNTLYTYNTFVMQAGDSNSIVYYVPKVSDTTLIEKIIFNAQIIREGEIYCPVFTESIPVASLLDTLYLFVNEEEIPVVKNTSIIAYVCNQNINKAIYAIPNSKVTLTNGKDINIVKYTDLAGKVQFNFNTKSTDKLYVTAERAGYYSKTDFVIPYMWSNVSDAFGMNNQENIVRKANTDSMFMVYTTGDSVIYGVSSNFGATWDSLRVLGAGNKPALIRTGAGLLVVWKETYNTLTYAIRHSPWTPIDTVNPTDLWPTEPVLGYNYTTNKTYMGYIGNRYVNVDRGDFVLGSMTGLDTMTMGFDTVVSYYGELDFVPMKSPVFSLYSQSTGIVSHLIGFIDTSDNYVGKNWNALLGFWDNVGTVSNANQTCNAPTTDYYGDATSFVYEAVNTDETKDIYRRKLNKGIIDANAVKVNVTTGKNEYPKASNGIFINYINNSNKLITNYSGNDISVYTGADSIHTTEFETKQVFTTKTRGYHIWSEGSNGNYRIKWMTRDYYPAVFTFIESEPEDTVEKVTTSPLYDYIGKKEPVEQLNTTINGLNPEMNYTVKVITSEGSPVKPQIIQIDGEVYAVVTGHANRSDTTEITLPKETYQDYSVVVSIDRKRGNPNRDAEVLVYQYETDGEEVVAASNKIKAFTPATETSTNLFTSKDNAYISYTSEIAGEVEIEIYNVMGSKVSTMKANVKEGTNNIGLKNLNKSGIFFVKINSDGMSETKRINIIK